MRINSIALLSYILGCLCLSGCQSNPNQTKTTQVETRQTQPAKWEYKVIHVKTLPRNKDYNRLQVELNRWKDWEVVSTFINPADDRDVPVITAVLKKQI